MAIDLAASAPSHVSILSIRRLRMIVSHQVYQNLHDDLPIYIPKSGLGICSCNQLGLPTIDDRHFILLDQHWPCVNQHQNLSLLLKELSRFLVDHQIHEGEQGRLVRYLIEICREGEEGRQGRLVGHLIVVCREEEEGA